MRIAALSSSMLLVSAFVTSGAPFYVLQGIDKTQPDSVLSAPALEGFTIRVSWQKLSEEGFAWLDDQIMRGDQFNVSIQLRVMAGKWAPSDLPGVSYFEYVDTAGQGGAQIDRAPVPWDVAMHLHWQAAVLELASRYAGNPRIKVVHIPGFADSSEMHTPGEVTQLAGYSSRVLAESWLAMAEPLVAAFPEAIVSLNYAPPASAEISSEDSEWLLDELAAVAGNQAGYQVNDLSANVSLDRPKYQTLVEQKQLGRHIGFQMLSRSAADRFGGTFGAAVATGLEAGAEWFEIYADDVDLIATAGDYNRNGIIDAADYVVWRKTLGQLGSNLAADGNGSGEIDSGDLDVWRLQFGHAASDISSAAGDFNKDGAVDAADYIVWRKYDGTQMGYNTWRANFGQPTGSGSSNSAMVPEPQIVWLPILGAAAGTWRGRRIASRVPSTR